MNISKLPYNCKELINMFALKNMVDYTAIEEFNKIADYAPCIYSNEKVIASEGRYIGFKKKFQKKENKLLSEYNYKARSDINKFYSDIFYEFNKFLCEKYFDDGINGLESSYLATKWKWDNDCLSGRKAENYTKYFRQLFNEEMYIRDNIIGHFFSDMNKIQIRNTRFVKVVFMNGGTVHEKWLGRLVIMQGKSVLNQLGIYISDKLLISIYNNDDDMRVNAPRIAYPYVEFLKLF